MKKLLAVVILCLTLTGVLLAPAAAGATPTLAQLAKTVSDLQKKVNAQQTQINALKTKLVAAKQVLALSPYLTVTQNPVNGVAGPNVLFRGVNVTVRSMSNEADTSGSGNLIVGWNEVPGGTLPSPFRTGSNNLVVGNANNFTSYGCFVAGTENLASDAYASVAGGRHNQATNGCAVVAGGAGNVAGGEYSVVVGGDSNSASGDEAVVGGGAFNNAISMGAVISGGLDLDQNSPAYFSWRAGPSYSWP